MLKKNTKNSAAKKEKGYEQLIYEISRKSVSEADKKAFLSSCIYALGKKSRASRVYLFENSSDNKKTSNTYEWVNKGIKPMKDRLQNIPYKNFPYWEKTLSANDIIYADDIRKLPKEVHRILEMQGIKSILVVPIFIRERFYGFLGFDECSHCRKWKASEISLLRAVAQIIGKYFQENIKAEQKKALEDKIYNTKSFLKAVIDSVQDAVLSTDTNGTILSWNKTAELLTGFSEKQMLGSHLSRLCLEPCLRKEKLLEKCNKYKEVVFQGKIKAKDNTARNVEVCMRLLQDSKGTIIGYVYIARDITNMAKISRVIKDGCMYLVATEDYAKACSVFAVIKEKAKKSVLIISREKPEIIRRICKATDFSYFWLSGKKDELSAAIKKAKEQIRKSPSIVILKRIDYIIGNYGFNKLLQLIYRINSLIMKSGSVFVVIANKKLLSEKELAFLKEEAIVFSGLDEEKPLLQNELIELLRYVYDSGKNGSYVTIKDISRNFGITRPTALGRIKKLLALGAISSTKQGRSRVIKITAAGVKYLVSSKGLDTEQFPA